MSIACGVQSSGAKAAWREGTGAGVGRKVAANAHIVKTAGRVAEGRKLE